MNDNVDKILVGLLVICAAMMSASLFLLLSTISIGGYLLFVIGSLIFSGIIGFFVYKDANKRRDPYPGAWALGTWLLLIIVLPLYLYHRAYGAAATS